jgi:SAM-dependent methyltransferase
MAYKLSFDAAKRKRKRLDVSAFLSDETRAPSDQNAVDVIPGWSSAFPAELNLRAGKLPLFSDNRIAWAIERFGDLNGRHVLELGPLEGAHTFALTQAGASVDAVEGNQLAYLKCLITREIMGFQNAKFFLGDFVLWLEDGEKTYDFIVACGVLYHMTDPLRLLRNIAKRTNTVYIWTVGVDDNREPSERVDFMGVSVRLYEVPYGKRSVEYCGGLSRSARWINCEDLVGVLDALGFGTLVTAHQEKVSELQIPSFSIFAKR